MHRLRVTYDDSLTAATFASELTGERIAFTFGTKSGPLATFLSHHFDRRVTLLRDDDGGYPDDVQAPGPTVVSTATLAAVASWFAGFSTDDVRLRLRANIELGGVPAFWEDRLFGGAGDAVRFQIGDAELAGTNPCARCVVPSRDARTGEALPAFAKRVSEARAATLPAWADRSRFDHFYRLAVNTRAPSAAGRVVRVGDTLSVAEQPKAVR